ncbi:MAG: hypothetical protein ACRC2K_06255 [Clostridium sp.]
MDGYQLIMRLQQKMNDPQFSFRFNQLTSELNSIPGLQAKVMEIMQMDSEKKRQKALDKLPSQAKGIVKELLTMINS